MTTEVKLCKGCDTYFPVSDYWKAGHNPKTGVSYRRPYCKTCDKARSKDRWVDKGPEYNFSKTLRKHNLTRVRYFQMLEDQEYGCGICSKPADASGRLEGKTLFVDHNHQCCEGVYSCGKCVRGLLCARCNLNLSSVENFGEKASKWLRRGLKEVVLCDLDGTIADTTHRRHLAPIPGGSWAPYAKACRLDKPIWGTIVTVRGLYRKAQIHFISGRDGSALLETECWLSQYGIEYDALELRSAGDDSLSNAEIKVRYVRSLRARGLEPILLLDDWEATCEAVEAEDVPTLRVANMKMLEPDGNRGDVKPS